MLLFSKAQADGAIGQRRSNACHELAAVGALLATGLFITALGLQMAGFWFPLAFVILVTASLSIFIKPILGVYLTLFFALVGDAPTLNWYPFGLNFSSPQSILYLHDALTISPIEVYLGITALAWIAQMAGSRTFRIDGQPLLAPMIVFVLTLFAGLVYGVIVRGGNTTVAVWEVRSLFYLPMTFLLVTNLFTKTAHYMYLAVCAVVAISIQNVLAIRFYLSLDELTAVDSEGLTEHAASIHYDWLFVLLIGALTFKGCTSRMRILMTAAAIPTVITFVLSQRRAAVVALGVGVLAFMVILLIRQRRAFYTLFPIMVASATGYTAAFWNSSGGIGFGARAIKTVIASDQVSDRDASSNLYRVIENFNLVSTVRANPLFGVGFGQPFDQPAQLPDISFFIFYEYIPHNSIVWIWLKTGYVGFVTLLLIIAVTVRAGTRAALRLPSGNLLAVTVAALAYVIMFLVFAFVDIAWEPRSALFLGACTALCVNILRLWEQESMELTESADAPRSLERL